MSHSVCYAHGYTTALVSIKFAKEIHGTLRKDIGHSYSYVINDIHMEPWATATYV